MEIDWKMMKGGVEKSDVVVLSHMMKCVTE